MNNEFLWFVVIVLFICFVCLRIYLKGKLPKYPSKPILTRAESDFLRALLVAVGNTYEIFPQIAAAKLINAPYRSIGWNKTSQKSVDFVLVDTTDFSTKLVIELDDASHNFADRIERDKLINEVLRNAKIPMLHYPNQRQYNPADIRAAIEQTLQKS